MVSPTNAAADILSCLAAADQNVHVSLLNARDVFDFFHRFDQHIQKMSDHLSKIKFDGDDPVYVNLTLLTLAQRQMRNAFIALLRCQSYDALLSFRPAVEAAIFAYRIFERKELGKVWVQRQEDFKTFSKEFRFAPLPERMPNREALDQYLDGLNDYRSHPNILYLAGWFEKTDGRLQLNYFDMEKVWWPALFAFISTAIRVI